MTVYTTEIIVEKFSFVKGGGATNTQNQVTNKGEKQEVKIAEPISGDLPF
jgi:hypothetical protein